MGLYAAYFKTTRPPGRYHEIAATLDGRRERDVPIKLKDIEARMAAYPLSREYRFNVWRRDYGF